MHGAINLENLHYFNGMQLESRLVPQSKYDKTFRGSIGPLMFMLCDITKLHISKFTQICVASCKEKLPRV